MRNQLKFPSNPGRLLRLAVRTAAVGFVLMAAPAVAYPEYPYTIQSELDTVCTPRCGTCHATEPGRAGTANKGFLRTLVELDGDVSSGDEDALARALALLADTDTDNDGVTDVDELTADPPSDPSNADLTPDKPDVGMCGAVVKYGCGASIAPVRHTETPWALFASGVGAAALLLLRKKRRLS